MNAEEINQYNSMTQYRLNECLVINAFNGNFDNVKKLLTSPYLKRKAEIKSNDSGVLLNACAYGHLEMVKYLLTSPELKEHANIHCDEDRVLIVSCKYGHLEIVKYLLTSPELKEHVNIHTQNDEAFLTVCDVEENTKHAQLREYFIFSMNIKKTKYIEHYLLQNNKEDILNLFHKRTLEKKLQKDLKNKKEINKIKL